MVDDGSVKLSTRVRRLREVMAIANAGWRDPELVEVWVAGRILDGVVEADGRGDVTVVLVVDLPVGEVTWLNQHQVPYALAGTLGIERRQLGWSSRPGGWPAWNQDALRVLRLWSAAGGEDAGVLDALEAGDVASLSVVEPSDGELLEQLRVEQPVTVAHVDEVVERYWDRDFRRGLKPNPEQVLWYAARAVRDLDEAIAALS